MCPIADAEHQKVANGLVALGGGHTEQLDEAVAALAMVIRNALTRLPAEIARTTNYYRSQHGGSAPRRVLLAGGGANLPYTLEFFQEKLNLPVEYFNPVRNVTIGKGVDPAVIQREGHLMGELVGLGLRGIGKSAINIDLVPHIVEQSRAADRRKPFLVAAAAVFVGGVALWATFQNIAASKASEEALTMEQSRETLAPLKADIDQLLKKEDALRQVAGGFTNAESDRVFWMDLLAEVRGGLRKRRGLADRPGAPQRLQSAGRGHQGYDRQGGFEESKWQVRGEGGFHGHRFRCILHARPQVGC